MPRGHKCLLDDVDFVAAAIHLEGAGEPVTIATLRMFLGVSQGVVTGRIKRLRQRPDWKPTWIDPEKCKPRMGHPLAFGKF